MKVLNLRKTLKHTVPFIALSTVAVVELNVLTEQYYNLICQQLGFGEMIITTDDEVDDLEGNYIDYKYSSSKEAKEAAQELTIEVEREGAVLLENDGLLPIAASTDKKAKVTVFGSYAWSMSHQGTGTSFYEALEKNAKFDVNPNSVKATSTSGISSTDEASFGKYNDLAIVTFGRSYGESNDVDLDLGESAGHRSELSLTDDELEMLQYACNKFNQVLVVISSDNTMELDFIKDRNKAGGYKNPYNGKTYDFSKVKGCLWAGGTGSRGSEALPEIIAGDVNPSGHLVDTYVRDLKSTPSAYNFGDFEYTNINSSNNGYGNDTKFVQYEEGIYVGYRYYETAYYESQHGNYDGFNYDQEVLYPFGYGLSYTNYQMSFVGNPVYDGDTNTYKFKVKVENKGDVAGKATAQVYVNAPYKNNGIEVSQVVLGGFAKTDVIEPHASTEITVDVSMDYAISYDYKTNKCYVQQGGEYNFYVSDNAHSWASADVNQVYSTTLDEVIYDGQSIAGHAEKRVSDEVTATNQMDGVTDYMFTDTKEDGKALNMSRSDFKGTFPTTPVGKDFIACQEVIDGIQKYDYKADNDDDDEEPELGNEVVLQLIDLRGKDFDDPAWDQFMHQLSLKSLYKIFADGSFGERADYDGCGVPEVIDLDSPYGFWGHATGLNLNVCSYYNSEVVLASTWNVELARAYGDSLGEEAGNQNKKITGLYGCALNIHRSSFCGRNFEYFSEDSLIAGKMAAVEMSAASEKGLTTYVKHFALNNQETNRNGGMSFANEQAIREIYTQGFEIYCKEATRTVYYYEKDEKTGEYKMVSNQLSGATGIMTSYNRVGAVWSGGCDGFGTMLRDEWGFTGNICTDGGGGKDSYMNTDQGLHSRATSMMLSSTELYDYKSATAQNDLLEAVKYNLFNRANSNAMVGIVSGTSITYGKAPWEKYVTLGTIGFITVDVALAAVIGYSVVSNIVTKKKEEDSVTVK